MRHSKVLLIGLLLVSAFAMVFAGCGSSSSDSTTTSTTTTTSGGGVPMLGAGMTPIAQQLWTWGYNGHNELGIGSTVTTRTPSLVSNVTNIKQLSFGWYHAVALKSDKSV